MKKSLAGIRDSDQKPNDKITKFAEVLESYDKMSYFRKFYGSDREYQDTDVQSAYQMMLSLIERSEKESKGAGRR